MEKRTVEGKRRHDLGKKKCITKRSKKKKLSVKFKMG